MNLLRWANIGFLDSLELYQGNEAQTFLDLLLKFPQKTDEESDNEKVYHKIRYQTYSIELVLRGF